MSISILFQLILATFLGSILGLEREIKKKQAGLQTYSLVSLGACLFTLISLKMFQDLTQNPSVSMDPVRIIQAIAVGIGFVGAGVIFYRGASVEGLTTAAGLWVTGAIGVSVGMKFYMVAIAAAVIAIVILSGLGYLEEKIFREKEKKKTPR
jgi:putative Mg2+ transporter-C (MgtC) family protein